MTTDYLNPNFGDIEQMVRRIAFQVTRSGYTPDVIVALARGGVVGGAMLSHLLKVPAVFPNFSAQDGQGDDKNHDNVLPTIESGKRVLIFDDILDSGLSVKQVREFYQDDHDVRVAVIYEKWGACTWSDYCALVIPKESGFVTFPWELSL